jgi:hypothetical protein
MPKENVKNPWSIVLSTEIGSSSLRTFQVCPDLTGKALTLDNCFTAFVALAFGMIVGFCFFVIECCSKLTKLNFYFLVNFDHSKKAALIIRWMKQKHQIVFALGKGG